MVHHPTSRKTVRDLRDNQAENEARVYENGSVTSIHKDKAVISSFVMEMR